jgi:hypothetical protein
MAQRMKRVPDLEILDPAQRKWSDRRVDLEDGDIVGVGSPDETSASPFRIRENHLELVTRLNDMGIGHKVAIRIPDESASEDSGFDLVTAIAPVRLLDSNQRGECRFVSFGKKALIFHDGPPLSCRWGNIGRIEFLQGAHAHFSSFE